MSASPRVRPILGCPPVAYGILSILHKERISLFKVDPVVADRLTKGAEKVQAAMKQQGVNIRDI